VHGRRFAALTLLVLAILSQTSAQASEVYFSPHDSVRQRLVRAIRESYQSIDIAVYNFTARELVDALSAAGARGVRIRLLMDREKAEEAGSRIRVLRRNGVTVRTLGVAGQSLMHHKFAVFDGRLVATGSYNWTHSAEQANYENLVVLDDREIVTRYQQEFNRLWRAARE